MQDFSRCPQDFSADRAAAPAAAARAREDRDAVAVTAALPSPTPVASRSGAQALTGRDRADALLAALIEMAALSLRRQADVTVAMRRAGLAFTRDTTAAALEQLSRDGCIGPPLYLSDGGILVSVTVRGIEHLATTTHRHVAAKLMSRGLG